MGERDVLAEVLHSEYWDDRLAHSPDGCGDMEEGSVDHLVAALAARGYSLQATPQPEAGLDAAWPAAEAALPEGWWLRDVVRDGNATMYRWQADAVGPKHWEEMYGDGPTPAAALLALAAALREPKP